MRDGELELQPLGENDISLAGLADVLAQLKRNNERLGDVKKQIAITGRVIDLYWLLQDGQISLEDYRKQLMKILEDW